MGRKKHNFSAGPAILPQDVISGASQAVKELDSIGLSLIEISHRGKEFVAVMEEAQQLVKDIYNLSDDYAVLFLQGGASLQFCMVPYNIMRKKAFYADTGSWAKKAIKEAKLFGNVESVSSSDKNYSYIPKDFNIPDDSDYCHITTNNTIFGTQYHNMPDTNIPLVADMSSDIFCRQLDASKFDLIYAGAQKNMGPAGTTLVIVKKSLLGKVNREIPTLLNYSTHIEKDSMFNTPPVFAIYASMLTLRWVKEQSLTAVEKQNKIKAEKVYNAIDNSGIFKGTASKEDRSLMNVTFVIANGYENLQDDFLKKCTEADIVGLKGHRSVGGFRASIYNAMPMESVDHLVNVMEEFEKEKG